MPWLIKSGKYYLIAYRERGVIKTFTTHLSEKSQAEKRLRQFKAEKELNLVKPTLKKLNESTLYLSDALAQFLLTKDISKSTERAYKLAVRQFTLEIPDKPLYQYKHVDFYKFKRKCQDNGLLVNTIATYARYLKGLFNWMVKNKMILENIIETVSPEAKEVEVIPEEDLNKILSHLTPDQLNIIEFLFYTGMRVGEAVLIKCEQVDTEHNIINMRNVKGKRFEQIPVIAPVAELFKRMDLKKEYLFQWRTYASVETFWKRLMERIVIVRDEKGNILPQKDKKGNLRPIQLETEVMIERPYSLHQFRKMCGTNLANSGVSPFFLRTYLRHKDIRTTLKYYTRADMNKLETEINDKVTWPVKKPVKK